MNIKQYFSFFIFNCCLVQLMGMELRGMAHAVESADNDVAAAACKKEKEIKQQDLDRQFIAALTERYGDLRYSFSYNYNKNASLKNIIDALEAGANVNCNLSTGYGLVALHIAADCCDVALVRELIHYNAKTGMRDGHKDTPVLVAAYGVFTTYKGGFRNEAENQIFVDYCLVFEKLWNHSAEEDKRYLFDLYGKKYDTADEGYDRLYFVRSAIMMFEDYFGCSIEDYDPYYFIEGT